jgi:hypothetical protein
MPHGDDAAIVKAQRLRRMFADQTDRLRQGEGVILGVGDAECGIQQSPRGNAPTWCWRTVAASMSTSTMSGAREGGSFNAPDVC